MRGSKITLDADSSCKIRLLDDVELSFEFQVCCDFSSKTNIFYYFPCAFLFFHLSILGCCKI